MGFSFLQTFRETQKVDVNNIPSNTSQASRKCPMSSKNLRAFEEMDKMMDDILVNDISGMCPFSFGSQHHKPPPSSKSDGHICGTNK